MYEMSIALFLGLIAGVAGTVYMYAKVMPKKYDGSFSNNILQKLHDYFNFKKLYIESVLKFVFVLATLLIVGFGFFTLFAYTGYGRYTESAFIYGVLMIVLGPIVLRLAYEGTMMFILLVKNTMEINEKLTAIKKNSEEKKEEKNDEVL